MVATTVKSGQLELSIADIPAIPALIADAIRVLEDVGASSTEIELVITRDQALATKILRVVNSAAYGFSRRIETVREAVVMLGGRKMRSIAGGMVTAGLYAKPVGDLLDPVSLWAHALAASTWAMQIIEYQRAWDAQSAVMGALLHDIGIAILGQYATEPYERVLKMSRDEGVDHTIIEQRELDTTHARVGAALCASWMLPVGLTSLVHHHHSQEPPTDHALGVLMLADHLAKVGGYKALSWDSEPVIQDGVLQSLSLEDADLERLLEMRESVAMRVDALIEIAKP